jgi:ubiquinone/menaquinone biosynthesis C-methylase UbiE
MSSERTTAGDFTAQAGFYARARPDYPDALMENLMRDAGVGPGDLAIDVGAGTGIASRCLARHGLAVVAVEPNAAMRAQALAADGVEWRAGSFESTGLDSAIADWVVAAQAFHWANPREALPEMRRILKSGRRFTAFWNDRDTASSALLTATVSEIRAVVPEFEERYRGRDWAATLVSTGDFEDPHALALRQVVVMGRERFLDLWRSHNHLNATAGPERFAEVIARLARMLDAMGDPELAVPYVCRAFSASACARA